MSMMKRYREICRDLGQELSEAYTGITAMEHDELAGRILGLRVMSDGDRTESMMLYYLVLKELLCSDSFLEFEALEDHDPEVLLRGFVNEAGIDEE
jgi:hypothetical protein